MSRRLDFGKDFRNHQARHGLSVKDEAEWMENDAAARWLRRTSCTFWNEITLPKTVKPRHAIIDPCDPHDHWRAWI
jgi:hypothetical protein